MSRSVTVLLLALMVGGLAARAETGLPRGPGVLLPLQDRVGEPRLARFVETLLQQELAAQGSPADTQDVRAVLRALRIRDASDEPPDRLLTLAERLGADWFFLATLHEAREGRLAERQDGGLGRTLGAEGAGDTPQATLSARIIQKGSEELWWAGFRAASGRDREGAFGVGEVETLEELLRNVVRQLVTEAATPRQAPDRPRFRHRQRGYSRASNTPFAPARVAVIPMDSVAELVASESAAVATAALFAALTDFGFRPLLPGLVRTIRQETGASYPGGASRPEWEALARDAGAEWLATGTVETYRRGVGRDPVPWVAFSVRFVNAGDGRIDWWDGLERSGRETASAFDRGRIYSSGDLTYAMMRSLLYGSRPTPGIARAGLGD
jgi:hypothetical protein